MGAWKDGQRGHVKPSFTTTSHSSGRLEQSQGCHPQGRWLYIILCQGHSSSIALAQPLLEHSTPAHMSGIQCHVVHVSVKLGILYGGLLNRNADQDQWVLTGMCIRMARDVSGSTGWFCSQWSFFSWRGV